MYLSKETVLQAFQLFSEKNPNQGATQKISAIRHLLALDIVLKQRQNRVKNINFIDCSNSQDKKEFETAIGKIVAITDGYYTANFFTSIKEHNGDFCAGSNFYSAGVLPKSRVAPEKEFLYPARESLLQVKNYKIYKKEEYTSNLIYYISTDKRKVAFILWLMRNEDIEDNNIYDAYIKFLNNTFSIDIADFFTIQKSKFDEIISESFKLSYEKNSPEINVSDVLNKFESPQNKKNSHNNNFTNNVQSRIILQALRAKPFLLLAGISGTGKSRIVKEMAFNSCPNIEDLRKDPTSPGNYCLIEVKPNWHDSTELLGYEDVLNGNKYHVTPFVKFLAKAMIYPDVPFFVCLDEMNLAPVEQYLAEFLSVLESRKLIDGVITSEPLIKAVFCETLQVQDLFNIEKPKSEGFAYNSTTEDSGHYGKENKILEAIKEGGLRIPPNVLVIGTVNMDETTHQFSRKVIDRAMTIEMNIEDGVKPFEDFFTDNRELSYTEKPLTKDLFLPSYAAASDALADLSADDKDYIKYEVPKLLASINDALNNTPFKIAYRVQNELIIYFAELRRQDQEIDNAQLLNKAVDDILLMKVLPRIEGDKDLLTSPLSLLHSFAENFEKSRKKIEEMQGRLESSQFVSFWP